MLKSLDKFSGCKGPVLTIVMDGIGINNSEIDNAVKRAYTPCLDMLMKAYPNTALKAHGTAVGMPSDDDMGNSEVGHNALGSGQVYSQGAKLVSEAIASRKMFGDNTWKEIVNNAINNDSSLHFLGLFSDGNVHSHINHLKEMIVQSKADGVKNVRVHILIDGRDVGETSALEYIDPFEEFLTSQNDENFTALIASGGGRMNITMDRYEADWSMIERGWKIHVLGEGRKFASANEAVTTYRNELQVIDQDLPGFVIANDDKPVGTIEDNDSVIFFNFRGDRSIEISKAFEDQDFNVFDRVRFPKTVFAGMLEYDGDLHIPSNYLVNPPVIKNTMSEFLVKSNVSQLAISETQKFGHVTYFWNGNKSGKFDEKLETYIEIPSDIIPFEQRPWMKAAEITDELIKQLKTGEYKYARINLANGDMVGHTGNMQAAIVAVETVDICLTRILKTLDVLGGVALITADHGNADEMFEMNKKTGEPKTNENGTFKSKTSHTLNKVPCIIYDNVSKGKYFIKNGEFGLSNVASTMVNLLGFEAPDCWDESLITFK